MQQKQAKQLKKIMKDGKQLNPMEMSKISERSEAEKPSERWQDNEVFKDRKPILEMEFWDDPTLIIEVK